MTETYEDNQELQVGGESKLVRVVLILVAVLLIFVGPTYVPWLIISAGAGDTAGIVIGFLLFVAGLGMLVYLIRKKIIT